MAEHDSKNGLTEIINVFLKYPGSAVQLLLGFITVAGVWFGLTAQITDVRGEVNKLHTVVDSNHDGSSADFAQIKAAIKESSENNQRQLTVLFSRGDTRYSDIQKSEADLKAGINTHDAKLAEMSADLRWIVRKLDSDVTRNPITKP